MKVVFFFKFSGIKSDVDLCYFRSILLFLSNTYFMHVKFGHLVKFACEVSFAYFFQKVISARLSCVNMMKVRLSCGFFFCISSTVGGDLASPRS